MKIGRFNLAGVSVVLLIAQLLLVSSVAAKYLYQRWTCPRVWTRASAVDPSFPMRGRYLALNLTFDGCQSTLPSAKDATFPRDVNGAVKPGPYAVQPQLVYFSADLKVESNKLVAIRIQDPGAHDDGQGITAAPGAPCDQMRLTDATDFYIADTAESPVPMKQRAELWIEVTVPPKGPPRPIQMALKQDGAWKPLEF